MKLRQRYLLVSLCHRPDITSKHLKLEDNENLNPSYHCLNSWWDQRGQLHSSIRSWNVKRSQGLVVFSWNPCKACWREGADFILKRTKVNRNHLMLLLIPHPAYLLVWPKQSAFYLTCLTENAIPSGGEEYLLQRLLVYMQCLSWKCKTHDL